MYILNRVEKKVMERWNSPKPIQLHLFFLKNKANKICFSFAMSRIYGNSHSRFREIIMMNISRSIIGFSIANGQVFPLVQFFNPLEYQMLHKSVYFLSFPRPLYFFGIACRLDCCSALLMRWTSTTVLLSCFLIAKNYLCFSRCRRGRRDSGWQ